MIITSKNAVHYLLECGLLTYESAVDGDLMIVDGASNHRNLKVIRKDHPGFFIKQIQKWDAPSIGSLQREAACYQLGHNDADFASIAGLLPKYYKYDPNRNVLIIELLAGGETLFQYCRRNDARLGENSAQLGAALGAYNDQAGVVMKHDPQSAAALAKSIPWILTVHQLPAAQSGFNAMSRELLAFIQSNQQFYYSLENLRSHWKFDSFIHGDIKLDNHIIAPPNEAETALSFKIIDWELAGFGDAGWDLGSAFQSFVSFPVVSMETIVSPLPNQLNNLLQLCSPEICLAIRQLWIGYVKTLSVDQHAAGEFLERSIRYCAARMIQTAFEFTETLRGGEPAFYADLLKAKAFCLLVIALEIFQNPVSAIGCLFSR